MSQAPSKPASILVVDDDESFAAMIGEWLTESGYAVTVTHDGQEAFARIRRHPPDVVVADIRMPRMNGLQLLDALKRFDTSIEVIFLSGQATFDEAVQALREGRGFDLIQKPLFKLQRLNVTIEKALRRSRESRPAAAPTTSYSLPVEQTLAYIADHLGAPLQVRDVASGLGYSPTYLTDLVRKETGKNIQQWIIHERLSRGAGLLRDTKWTVEAIASTLGYTDPAYFSRQFRQHYGMTPLEWRAHRRRSPRT